MVRKLDGKLDGQKEYFHKDSAYGLNDWEPVVAFVRGLLENTEDKQCFPRTRARVLADNSLLSQTLIQHLGCMKDGRGVEIIREKLARLGPDDRTIASPWCRGGRHLEAVCLEALAKIGGQEARRIIENYRADPAKSYLAAELENLQVSDEPRRCVAPLPEDFPEILKGIRSIHDVLGEGGNSAEYPPNKAQRIIKAWRGLAWPGPVEFFSGDGETTTFKPRNKITDHIHDFSDPFSDFGIFLSNPKVEYPVGRRRWADSHTFLCFQIADGALYGHEYVWNVADNTITTHFHHHVVIEEVTVNQDGQSVTVAHKPISTGVEVRGNVFSRKCTSAVRGVWDNPEKQGANYYVRRANVITPYKRLFYFRPLHAPVVNQLGIWVVDESEHPERFFDGIGNCTDVEGVINELLIPLHEPKILAWTQEQYKPTGERDRFARRIPRKMWVDLSPVPPASILDPVLGAGFEHSHCGNAGIQQDLDNGYRNGLDINCDGIIDEEDKRILARHAGEVYRMNVGDYGYFGINWLSTGQCPRSTNLLTNEAVIFVCSYDYGAGYDPDTGVVRLFQPAKPGTKLYIEYHYDAPPAEGKDNIKVYLHAEI